MKTEILLVIKDVLKKVLNLPAEKEIHSDASLREELGLDSMSTLSFLIELEERVDNFTVDPDTLDINDLKTVDSVVNYVVRETQVSASV